MFILAGIFSGLSYIEDCRGVVQLGGPDPWYNWGGPTKLRAPM